MRILLLGSDYFKPWLVQAGVEVIWAGQEPDCDLAANLDRVEVSRLIARLDPPPDLLLLTDDLGRRTLPWGLDRCPIPTAYYGVDGPLNLFWQRHLAGFFDLAAVDQKDTAQALADRLDRPVHWLPVAVDPADYLGSATGQPEHDFGFVGAVEASVRPKRANIINLLKSKYDVQAVGARGQGWVSPAEAAKIYRQAKLALNENLFPGVTTRMFEIMASGGCLFTELTDNGLADLFELGRHLIAFGPDNILDLAERYLADQPARRQIARAGQEAVLAGHTIAHRAQQLLTWLEQTLAGEQAARPGPIDLGWAFLLKALRWPDKNGDRRSMQARIQFQRAVKAEPDRAEAHYGLGLSLAAIGKPGEAAETVARAAGLEPEKIDYHLAEGLLRLQAGESGPGEAVLFRAEHLARQAAPDLADIQAGRPGQAEFHYFWGRALTESGQGLIPGFSRQQRPMVFWGGLEHLVAAIGLKPDHVAALIAAARLLDSHGQAAASHDLWRRAAELAPDEAHIQGRDRAARAGYVNLNSPDGRTRK